MPWSVTEVAHDVMYIIRRTLIHDDLDTAEDEDIVLAYHDYIDDELLARISYQDEQAVYDNIAARSEMIDVPDEEFDRVQERTLNYLEYHLNYREDSEPAHQTAPAAWVTATSLEKGSVRLKPGGYLSSTPITPN